MLIKSLPFRTGSAIYVRESARHLLGRFWFVVAVPIVAMTLYGLTIDWRFLLVTLCVVLILFPTFILVGYNMALTSASAIRSLFTQEVTLHPDGELTITYHPIPATDTLPERKAPDTISIPRRHIDSCTPWHAATVIKYCGNQTLIIPDTAFASRDDLLAFWRRLPAPSDPR